MAELRRPLAALAVALVAALLAGCGGGDSSEEGPYETYTGQGVSFEYPTGEGWSLNDAEVGEGMRAEKLESDEDYSTASQVRFDGRNPYETNEEAYESYRDTSEGFEVVEEREASVEGTLGSRIFVTEFEGRLPDGTIQKMRETTLFIAVDDGTGARLGWELSVIVPAGTDYPDAERVIDSLVVDEST